MSFSFLWEMAKRRMLEDSTSQLVPTSFSGDTLFAGAIGRTDHPGGDYDKLMKSILENVITLDGSIAVIPGHGPVTDIATEGMTNPFLLPFNEPYED